MISIKLVGKHKQFKKVDGKNKPYNAPRLEITGKQLEAAKIDVGDYVEVSVPKPGSLLIEKKATK